MGHKWEATNFCKCMCLHSTMSFSCRSLPYAQLGICFGSNYTILHMAIPDNPSKPCLSCTKQWCLNQNLHICAGAKLPDANPDTATGKEGDVEARCFRKFSFTEFIALANCAQNEIPQGISLLSPSFYLLCLVFSLVQVSRIEC